MSKFLTEKISLCEDEEIEIVNDDKIDTSVVDDTQAYGVVNDVNSLINDATGLASRIKDIQLWVESDEFNGLSQEDKTSVLGILDEISKQENINVELYNNLLHIISPERAEAKEVADEVTGSISVSDSVDTDVTTESLKEDKDLKKYRPNDFSDEFTEEEISNFLKNKDNKTDAIGGNKNRKKKVFVNKDEKEKFLSELQKDEKSQVMADEFDTKPCDDDRVLVYWEVYYYDDKNESLKETLTDEDSKKIKSVIDDLIEISHDCDVNTLYSLGSVIEDLKSLVKDDVDEKLTESKKTNSNDFHYTFDILCDDSFNDGVVKRRVELFAPDFKTLKKDANDYVKEIFGDDIYKLATKEGPLTIKVTNTDDDSVKVEENLKDRKIVVKSKLKESKEKTYKDNIIEYSKGYNYYIIRDLEGGVKGYIPGWEVKSYDEIYKRIDDNKLERTEDFIKDESLKESKDCKEFGTVSVCKDENGNTTFKIGPFDVNLDVANSMLSYYEKRIEDNLLTKDDVVYSEYINLKKAIDYANGTEPLKESLPAGTKISNVLDVDDDMDISDDIFDWGENINNPGDDVSDGYNRVMKIFCDNIECTNRNTDWYSNCKVSEYIEKNIDKFNTFLNQAYKEEYQPQNLEKQYTIKEDGEEFYDVYMDMMSGLLRGSFATSDYDLLADILEGKKPVVKGKSTKQYIYQFAKDGLNSKDIRVAQKDYDLKYLGKVSEEGSQPGDIVLQGSKQDIERYFSDYLQDPELLHPDYLYEFEDFDTDILEKLNK